MLPATCPIRSIVAACIASVALLACGGDEDELPGTAPDAIATPEQVRAHLTFVMSQAPIPRVNHMGALPLMVPAPFACTASGSLEVGTDTRDSPYTEEPLAVESIRYRDCVRFDGPPTDPGSAITRLHGVEQSARVQSATDTTITYVGSGTTAGPLERQVRANAQNGTYEEDHHLFRRIDGQERQAFFGFLHEVGASVFITHELSIRYPDGASFAGSYRIGSEAAPLMVSSRNNAMRIDGTYEISTTQCRTGSMQVETVRELAYDTRTSRFTGGQLRFTTEGGTATAVFTRNGSVRLHGANGTELVEPWQTPVAPWDSTCFAAEGP